jgi:hypothetical protein
MHNAVLIQISNDRWEITHINRHTDIP